MERGPQQQCDGIDGTELDIAVTDRPMLIHTARLVVFCIVQEDAEYLLFSACAQPQLW